MGYIFGNLGAILAATLVGLAIGFAYAAAWRRAASPALRPPGVAVAVLAEFWLASILAGALILAPEQAGRWTIAIGSAVVIWIGFVLPTVAVGYGFRRQGIAATLLDAAHWLAVMVAQAATLEGIGLTRP